MLLPLVVEGLTGLRRRVDLVQRLQQLGVDERLGAALAAVRLGEMIIGVGVDEDLAVDRLEALGESVEHREASRLLFLVEEEAVADERAKLAAGLEEVVAPERAMQRDHGERVVAA